MKIDQASITMEETELSRGSQRRLRIGVGVQKAKSDCRKACDAMMNALVIPQRLGRLMIMYTCADLAFPSINLIV